jgi:hypothetical protein
VNIRGRFRAAILRTHDTEHAGGARDSTTCEDLVAVSRASDVQRY